MVHIDTTPSMLLSYGWRPIASDAHAAQLLRREIKRLKSQSPAFLLSIKAGNWYMFEPRRSQQRV